MASAQPSTASNAQKALIANQQIRQILLGSAPRMRKNLGNSTGTNSVAASNNVGGTTRVKIFNVGLITSLQIYVTLPVTIAGGVATGSPRAPYNLISRIRLTDYDGTDRVNWSGFQLFVINCIRARIPYGVNNQGPIVTAGGSSVLGGIIVNPSLPTQIGNGTISFLLDVPVAYDPESDLRGCILGQTAVGEMYLNIDWAPQLVNANNVDGVYTNAAGTVVLNGVTGPTVQVWQEYLLPQAVNGQLPLPTIDLQTVYELSGNQRSSDNIAVAAEKQINYPNVRSVIGGYFNYIDGAANMLATDITQFRLIANGNNILRDDTQLSQQIRQRNYLEGDIAAGTYWYLHRSKPIETALFGNIQAGITPNTANAGAFFELGFESFYTKGSALPGVPQS